MKTNFEVWNLNLITNVILQLGSLWLKDLHFLWFKAVLKCSLSETRQCGAFFKPIFHENELNLEA